MVGVFHRNAFHCEPVSLSKRSHVGHIIVSQEDITRDGLRYSKQMFMVDRVVSVQPSTRTLTVRPTSRVRRVYKKCGFLMVLMFPHHFDAVTLNNCKPFSYRSNS